MKKNVVISISKCLKLAAKNRRAILSAPTVYVRKMKKINCSVGSDRK